MSRTFAYARVSTFDQTPENQIREIQAAGFAVEPHRIVSETISGSMAIAQRRGFSRLMDKMENGDVLIVTKLDRLGRDTIDVSTIVAKLEDTGIRVHCLALGGVDLTSPAGKMTMNVINAVALHAMGWFNELLTKDRDWSENASLQARAHLLRTPKSCNFPQKSKCERCQ